MLARGYDRLERITAEDLIEADWGTAARVDTIDALLCHLGVFDRTAVRGWSKTRRARHQPTVAELVSRKGIAERFAPLTVCYLEHARSRLGYTHGTIKARVQNIARFWWFIEETYPEIDEPAKLRPEHGRAFLQASIEHSRTVRRGPGADGREDDRLTVYATVGDVRVIFHPAASSAWAATTPNPRRAPPRRSAGCSSATAANSPARTRAANRPGRSQPASSRSSASSTHSSAPRSWRPMSPTRSSPPPP